MNDFSAKIICFIAAAILVLSVSVPVFATPPISFGVDASVVKVGEGGVSDTWSAGHHSIAAVGDNVYATWCGNGSGSTRTSWFAASADGGRLWGPMKAIATDCSDGTSLAVGADGTIHVVWDYYVYPNPRAIMYSQSTDGGSTWSTPVPVNGTVAPSWAASVAVDSNGNIHVAWHASSPEDVYDSVSSNGSQWTTHLVTTDSSYRGEGPSIGADGSGNVYMAWECQSTNVCFSKSTNGGSSWQSPPSVVNNTYTAGYPSLAVSAAGDVYIAWGDYNSDKELTAYLASGSSTWGITEVTSSTAASNMGTSVAVSPNGDVNVAYYVEDSSANCTGSNWATFFSRSTNGGVSYGSRVFIDCQQTEPILAIDQNNKALIMWSGWNPEVISFTREQ